jgi:NhaA family Na+:H+ antiporter
LTAPRAAYGLVRAFQRFVRLEAAGGILLLACTGVALVWANSPLAALYNDLWHTPVTIGAGGFVLAKDLQHWVNDGLMAIFFFVIGLEIKRELLVGELASRRQAALPAAAALGGMVVPAGLYILINRSGPASAGWGVPMATDIAFALGVLALLGRRVPLGLKVFLTALAIVDDLGAVLVIAVFYTAALDWTMVAVSVAHVRHPAVYGALGVLLWIAFLESGVHATVAGVLAALTIPSRARIDMRTFRERSRGVLDRLELSDPDPTPHMMSGEQQEAIYALNALVEGVETPLQRLEHALLPWVTFVIMPVFALANAGVALGGGLADAVRHPVTLGVAGGLVIGKLVGVTVFARLAIALGIAERPAGVTNRHILGASALAGIGFTMSLFIASLAFGESALLDLAKIGVLGASLLAGLLGTAILLRTR